MTKKTKLLNVAILINCQATLRMTPFAFLQSYGSEINQGANQRTLLKKMGLFLTIFWVCLTANSAYTSPASPNYDSEYPLPSERVIDNADAAGIAQTAFGGTVIEITKIVIDNRAMFRVKLDDNGRIRIVNVDAVSGRIID